MRFYLARGNKLSRRTWDGYVAIPCGTLGYSRSTIPSASILLRIDNGHGSIDESGISSGVAGVLLWNSLAAAEAAPCRPSMRRIEVERRLCFRDAEHLSSRVVCQRTPQR